MSFDIKTEKALNALIIARHNIAYIKQWSVGQSYEALCGDVMRCYAIQYAFITLAEAVKDIPDSILERHHPLSYWRDIVDFRNHLAHTYDDKLDHRIMNTIHVDIPELDGILEKILADMESPKS